MIRSRMRRVTVAAGAIAVLVVSGCGVQAGSGSASGTKVALQAGSFSGTRGAATLARSATETGKVKTMRMVMTEKVDGGPIALDITASGEFDLAARRGHLSMDIGGF